MATAVITAQYETLEERLDALFALKTPIDTFFDTVMVNHEDLTDTCQSKSIGRDDLSRDLYHCRHQKYHLMM